MPVSLDLDVTGRIKQIVPPAESPLVRGNQPTGQAPLAPSTEFLVGGRASLRSRAADGRDDEPEIV